MLLRAPLHVLIVDDSIDDVDLLLRELRRQYDVMHAHVATEAGLREALARPWDIVISDWSMPGFGGLEAYAIVRDVAPELPFLILSGVIDEEDAVQALKAGVHDFLSKGKLARLLPAIERELREAEVRRREREAEATVAQQRERVARSEAMHRAMFEHSPMPMWTYDRESMRFLAVNEAAIRHYGYTRDEFLGMTIRDIRPREDVAALKTLDGHVNAGRWRHRKKDGSIILVEIVASDLVMDGHATRLVLVNDVTDRVRTEQALRSTEEQLRQAQKMDAIGQLAGGVAHDFNNMLTVIESYACMLEESLEESDHRRADASEIRGASQRAAQLTRQLLAMSRSTVVQPRSLDLRRAVEAFTPMIRRLIGERVSVDVRLDEVPPVLADPGQLEQVLMNLAVNARDAMPNGGRITIETRALDLDAEAARLRGLAPGRVVELAVTDTGTGMSADVRARIFDPFFTTKDPGTGTGLGLSIVHGIVTQAGGTVTVYSELGHGTTFRVHLPIASEPVDAPVAVPVIEAPRRFPGITVLVVDDDPGIRTLLARVLQDAGCQTLDAATADDARRLCVDHDRAIDVAIVDVVLPDARGDLLVMELRELRPALRTLLMSGYPAGALTPSRRAPLHLLTKPFSPPEVRSMLARVLELRADSGAVERASSTTSDRWRVLVVDDEAYIRRMLVRALRHAGLEVVEADGARAALAAFDRTSFDVVLSDVHMPGGTGLELMRELRRRAPELPVLLMSGLPDVESAAIAVQYGAFRYLTKPVDLAEIGKLAHQAARAHAFARLRREALAVSGRQVETVDRVELERCFGNALELAWMAFQPIVTARGGVRFAVEALLRSDEPAMSTPGAILDAATNLGRLHHVGRRVRALCAETLATRTDSTMFLNVHPRDLEDPDLVDEAAPLSALASRVVLEITERATLRMSPALTDTLARLRALGFRIAVDDIGAGYSGLATFAELMPEIVKIDMSLVRDVHRSAIKQQTLAALTTLCKDLGTLVVAEGVESVAERDCLVDLGCELLQGFLFGRPERGLP